MDKKANQHLKTRHVKPPGRVTGLQKSNDVMFKSNIELNHKREAHLEAEILKTRRVSMRIFQFISIFVVSLRYSG